MNNQYIVEGTSQLQHLINPEYTIKQVDYLLSFKLVIELEEPGKLV